MNPEARRRAPLLMPSLIRILLIAALALVCGACSHSIPRVPPDYTEWVLINCPVPPEPAIPHEDGAIDRLVDGIKAPILGPAEPRTKPVQVAIPAGVRTASGGIYVDVWIVGKDADRLAAAMAGGLNTGSICPSQLFLVRVDGNEIPLASPLIERSDFVSWLWFGPQPIPDGAFAPQRFAPGFQEPWRSTRVLQPFMLRCAPFEAETCEVTVRGPTQAREMNRPVEGSTAVVPVRSAR